MVPSRSGYFVGYTNVQKKNYLDFPSYFENQLEELYYTCTSSGIDSNQFLQEAYRRFGSSASKSSIVARTERTGKPTGEYCKTCDTSHPKCEFDAIGRCKNALKQRKSVYAALFWNKYSSEGALPFSASSRAAQ